VSIAQVTLASFVNFIHEINSHISHTLFLNIISPEELNNNARPFSLKEGKKRSQKHLVTRVHNLVKTVIFPKLKFINNANMLKKTMLRVMENLDVPVGSYEEFKTIYVSEVMVAINTKRGTVGQSAGKVVQRKTAVSKLTNNRASCSKANQYSFVVMPTEHLSDMDSSYMKALESRLQRIADGGPDEPTPIKDTLFTVQEILTMRGATTPREMEAQYWFYGTFLECIAGKRAWGSKKFHTAITSAIRTGNETQKPDAVSISDEAFAIVLFENYRQKWIEKHEQKLLRGSASTEGMDVRMYGKFTERNVGQSQFSGWTSEGIHKFNTYCNLVQDDRRSDHCRAAEEELRQRLRQSDAGKRYIVRQESNKKRKGVQHSRDQADDAYSDFW
jgi:hypothetical protein